MTTQIVSIAAIHPHVAAQPRAAVDIDKVAEYVDDLARGDKFPPMIVFHDGPNYWLADGFHRYYAAKTAKLESFECDVREGGLRDATLYSCGANSAHGLRRTTEDKRRAVGKLLADPEWSNWSAARIAAICSVGDHFVEKCRKEYAKITSSERSEALSHRNNNRKFVDRYGNVSVMNVSNIGGKADSVEPNVIAEQIKFIRTAIENLPAPKDAAQGFPEDQRYLFPIARLRGMAEWLLAFAEAMEKRMIEHASKAI